MIHILHVVGARPNFMKAAPVHAAFARRGVRQTLVHTGQHYDALMSDVFFRELGLPEPDVNLEVGSGSHAEQTARIMMKFEAVVSERKPDWVLVYGDVNSTVAASLVCAKLSIRVAHVEAGLRSGDRAMPEEINRLVTDRLSDLLLTHSPDADEHLAREGVPSAQIVRVGNVMIDTLVKLLPIADSRWPELQARISLDSYGLVTLHRPSNVDDAASLAKMIAALSAISRRLPLLFPVHPRTRQRIVAGAIEVSPTVMLTDPVGYLDFLALQKHATVVITDSGGVQEETTYLGVPCLTLRENTERPITIDAGTNILIGNDLERLQREVEAILDGRAKKGGRPPLWDGHASERIADTILGR
jgi:UDP-N-acetylglucosamine 2-epimerase (non-hydrolysing)